MLRIFLILSLMVGAKKASAHSPAFEKIDKYIQSKDFATEVDLLNRMNELERKILPIVVKRKNATHFYSATLTTAEVEARSANLTSPYLDHKWCSFARQEVHKFCCDVRTNESHRHILLNWLDKTLDEPESTK